MSDPIYIAFATQKGGAGKSTLTTLVASYLYYVEGVEVAAIDCDKNQHTLEVYRKHDKLVTEENPFLKRTMHRFYSQFKKRPYSIIKADPSEAIRAAQYHLDSGNSPSVIFFDVTGTINDRATVNLIGNMDYIFVPITTETGEMASSISFANIVNNRLITTGASKVKELYLVWNKVKTREKPRLCEIIDNYLAKLGLHSLDSVLIRSDKFEKDGYESGNSGIFRSTLLPPDKRLLRGNTLPDLVAEIRKIINV